MRVDDYIVQITSFINNANFYSDAVFNITQIKNLIWNIRTMKISDNPIK